MNKISQVVWLCTLIVWAVWLALWYRTSTTIRLQNNTTLSKEYNDEKTPLLTCTDVGTSRVDCAIAQWQYQLYERWQRNIYWKPLESCSIDPLTWRFRDWYCRTDENDRGIHVVCAEVTNEFLAYSKNLGNDLITPNSRSWFPWLKDGDHRCLCAARWLEATSVWIPMKIKKDATHAIMKSYIQ